MDKIHQTAHILDWGVGQNPMPQVEDMPPPAAHTIYNRGGTGAQVVPGEFSSGFAQQRHVAEDTLTMEADH